MKKFLYISGIVLVNLTMFGMLFKIQHWPGAGILLTVGLGLFCLIFLPLALINSFRGEGKTKIALYIAGYITALIVLTGAIFKIQHWPGSNVLLVVGVPLPFILFLPVYIYFHNKEKGKADAGFLGVMFMMVYIAVYSGLLAVNVSKSVMNAFKNYDKEFVASASLYENKCKNTVATFSELTNEKSKKSAQEIAQKSDEICNYIENTKIMCIRVLEGENSPAIQNKKFDFSQVRLLAATQPYFVMMGATGEKEGAAQKIKFYVDDLKKTINASLNNSGKRDSLLNTDAFLNSFLNPAATPANELSILFPKTVAGLLTDLSMIQSNVRMAESDALFQLKHF